MLTTWLRPYRGRKLHCTTPEGEAALCGLTPRADQYGLTWFWGSDQFGYCECCMARLGRALKAERGET